MPGLAFATSNGWEDSSGTRMLYYTGGDLLMGKSAQAQLRVRIVGEGADEERLIVAEMRSQREHEHLRHEAHRAVSRHRKANRRSRGIKHRGIGALRRQRAAMVDRRVEKNEARLLRASYDDRTTWSESKSTVAKQFEIKQRRPRGVPDTLCLFWGEVSTAHIRAIFA